MAGNDKLSIINSALISISRGPVAVADDNTPEWIYGSEAYERALPAMLSKRDWKFQTAVSACTRVGASSVPGFPTSTPAGALPAPDRRLFDHDGRAGDCRAVLLVFTRKAVRSALRLSDDWRSDPLRRAGRRDGVYVQAPLTDKEWHPAFREALVETMIAMLERSLNRDTDAAKLAIAMAAGALGMRRPRARTIRAAQGGVSDANQGCPSPAEVLMAGQKITTVQRDFSGGQIDARARRSDDLDLGARQLPDNENCRSIVCQDGPRSSRTACALQFCVCGTCRVFSHHARKGVPLPL